MAIIPDTHKVLTLPSVGEPLELRTVPTPPLIAGSAIVRVLSAHIWPHAGLFFNGTLKHLTFPTPFVPGNTAVCRVLAVAPDATAVKEGDLVLIDPYVLARDDPRESQILFGLHDGATPGTKRLFADTWRNGLWAEMARVPIENCCVLDEDVLTGRGYTPSTLNFITWLAVAYGGIQAVKLRAGETIIVAPSTGHYSGAIVALASALGAKVIALGRTASKLARLKETFPRVETVTLTSDIDADAASIQTMLGPKSPGADAFIDISPGGTVDPPHLASAIRSVRSGGHVAFMGVPRDVKIDYAVFMFRNMTVKGQYMYSREDMRHVVRMVEEGVLRLDGAGGYEVAGEFGLEDWEGALRAADGNSEFGRMVTFVP